MNEAIKKFIQQQTCASVCCIDKENKPYCFSCFYAFDEENKVLYFKSGDDTRHSELLKKNPAVAGTILPDKLNKLQIKGLQFEGELLHVTHPDPKDTADIYCQYASFSNGDRYEVWTIKNSSIKYTDSSLGFGKKIGWKREESLFCN
ncbi:MAG TPA: pyridoxamine 5'-phosphate oxidase family protein [Chitinophagaceae bacterium]|nr:pyridoxamine 5'-phosphate oxidase family protein [Chitinophagaceae bacterium]